MPCRLLALPWIFVELLSFVPPAALPPLPMDEDVPFAPVEVAPTPSVDADVPPTAALPPLPPVALCAAAIEMELMLSAPASKTSRIFLIASDPSCRRD